MNIKHTVVVAILFPLIYLLYSLSPWAVELFVNHNADYFYKFWLGIILLHWTSFYIVFVFLKKENLSLKEIGYKLNKNGTITLISSFLIVSMLMFGFVEMSLNYVEIDQEKLDAMTNFLPKTTGQRLFYILGVFTAGFCEEIIYRGYLINKYSNFGLNKWISIIPAGISFVFIHGINGYFHFTNYIVFALIMGVIFLFSKRLLPVIIGHLLYNLMAMMAVLQAVSS